MHRNHVVSHRDPEPIPACNALHESHPEPIKEFLMRQSAIQPKVMGQGMTEYIIVVALIAVAA
jgi:hypothetical protein